MILLSVSARLSTPQLRVCAFGQEELYFYNARDPLGFISPINEMAALRNLKRRLRAELELKHVSATAQACRVSSWLVF
jgi:hypothetical protein